MRLVAWNCAMAFHRKADALLALEPDVAVIGECANADHLAAKAPGLPSPIWMGNNQHKGLGVFTFNGYEARLARDVDGSLGLASVYHERTGDAQGEETTPTIYWRDRKEDGPTYHLDYIFTPRPWLERLAHFEIGTFADWVGSGLSDHLPVVIDLE